MNLEKVKDRYVDYEYDFNLKKEHIDWLIEQAEKVEEIKKTLHESTDTDNLHFNDDGSIEYLNEREALDEIEKMVTPIEEREEEKRYRLKVSLPALDRIGTLYLVEDKQTKKRILDGPILSDGYKRVFTESELKDIDETGFKRDEVK